MIIKRRHKYVLTALGLYWPALFFLTHIPIPDIARESGMSDKTMHFLAYMVLMFLVWLSISPYQKVNWKTTRVWLVLMIVVWYGVIDEALQGLMGRSADVGDFFADLTGALVCLGILSVFSFWPAALTVIIIFLFTISNLSSIDLLTTHSYLNTGFHFIGYAFLALVWIQLTGRMLLNDRKFNSIKWLFISAAMPVGFLAAVKLSGLYFNKMFRIYDIYTAIAGIMLIITLCWIIYLLDINNRSKELKV